ncbi:hypothetical protein [Actinomadura sediminis]|uniref:Uncharacterized protein n=1 Tax=Actinomadura sediminis TaxID=1038904 RepID=A0ABW3EY23_9ACTN
MFGSAPAGPSTLVSARTVRRALSNPAPTGRVRVPLITGGELDATTAPRLTGFLPGLGCSARLPAAVSSPRE